MRTAVISDIHANLDALKVVLADIDERGVDRHFAEVELALGSDHAFGQLRLGVSLQEPSQRIARFGRFEQVAGQRRVEGEPHEVDAQVDQGPHGGLDVVAR
ncbi:MAG: hypothetical protein AAF085_08215, partial [Planctomycetota bacterium]